MLLYFYTEILLYRLTKKGKNFKLSKFLKKFVYLLTFLSYYTIKFLTLKLSIDHNIYFNVAIFI